MRLAVEANAMKRDRRGIGRYVRQVLLSAARLRSDLQVLLLASRPEDLLALEAELPSLGLHDARGAVGLPSTLSSFRPDVVWFPWPRIRSRIPGVRLVATIHDLAPFHHYDQSWLRRLDRWRRQQRLRRTARLADRIITDSNFSHGEVLHHLGLNCAGVTAIPLAADDFTHVGETPDRELLERRFGIAGEYLLCVGAGDRRKNLPRLLEAYRALNRPDVSLVLCGTSRSTGDGEPGVRRLSRVHDDELRALYRSATALVQPSLLEGFGLPVLEAMASGTPVLCSNTTSLPEVAGDAALYFDPTDVQALTAAMARCLDDPELRAELVARGAAQARKFSWEATARRTLEVFDAALSADQPAGAR